MARLSEWGIPQDAHEYLLKRDLTDLVGRIAAELGYLPKFIGTLLGHTLKHLEGTRLSDASFTPGNVYELCETVKQQNLEEGIIPELLAALYENPNQGFDTALASIGYKRQTADAIVQQIPALGETFEQIRTSPDPEARIRWIMGELHTQAQGNMPMRDLRTQVETVAAHV
jgi:glutamyl-tRNA(Gln) amidotransferase subunit E